MDAVELMAVMLGLALLVLAVTIAVVFGGVVWWHAVIFLCTYNALLNGVRTLKDKA